VTASLLALLLRFALSSVLDESSPYIFPLLAVIVTAFLGGFRAGLLAMLISVVGVNYLITQPALRFNFDLTVPQVVS
jgi:K+-sensing histidine kinase KdpD